MELPRGIPNFAEVASGIFRGGQPNAEGWAYLRSRGVRQVVKLNPTSEAADNPGFPVETNYFPIDKTRQILTEPDLQSIRDVIAFITPGTFVHCTHGQDRTGLIIGCWRLRQGWTKAAAWDEMLARGFHPLLFGLWKAWSDFTP